MCDETLSCRGVGLYALCYTCVVCWLAHAQRREVEYDKYLRDKMVTAKNEFRSLLKETKIITYK